MKKFLKILIIPFCILTFCLAGCNQENISVNYVRTTITQRQKSKDYCLDFTIKFENNTSDEQIIKKEDFYIKLNQKEITEISFLYELEETFYIQPTINKNETKDIRLRIITKEKTNQILIKYNDKLLIEDEFNIYT